MDIKEKIKKTFEGTLIGKKYKSDEINKEVIEKFNDIKKNSILPADRCYNKTNKGLTFDNELHIFEYLKDEDKYMYIGEGYKYNGKIMFNGVNSVREREVGEWIDGKPKFYINTMEAIWVAAAILAYEKYNSSDNPTSDDMFFSQADIVNRAKDIHGANVQPALASTHTVATHKDTNYNYLVAGKSNLEKYRRVSYYMEFDGIKEKPDLNKDLIIESTLRDISIEDLINFINKEYSEMFTVNEKETLLRTTKCISVLEYLDKYAGQPYKGPEKADIREKEKFVEMKNAGSTAVKELNKMARLCEILFGLKSVGPSKWLDGSNTKIREYLWQQMKLPGYENSPSSISIFAELTEGQISRFRFSVELNDSQSGQKDYDKHHRILERDITLGQNLVYMLGGNNSSTPMRQLNESTKEVKEKVKNGTYKKIQVSLIITRSDIKTKYLHDFGVLHGMLEAIRELMPYYKLIIGENIEDTGSGKTLPEVKVEEMNKYIDLNTILYGPPGTGKTYNTVNYAVAIIERKPLISVKTEDYSDVYDRYLKYKNEGSIVFTTFHQSYGYEEFIEGIKPQLEYNKLGIDLQYYLADGVFKKFCYDAQNTEAKEPHVFIIDEINRGNISKIFGELITLIEDKKRLGETEEMTAKLPYSGDNFGVPNNVYILGTMNTADRSIALMDTALRRRFNFVEMMPESSVLQSIPEIEGINIIKMLDIINERIELLYDREHTIGHAYFTCLNEETTIERLGNVFKNSIVPLLQEYFYEDYSKIQLVLGDNAKEDKYKFILNTDVKIKSVFKGNIDMDFDYLPEKKYSIQNNAFNEPESYKQIY